jgi:hypothetical protein
MEEQVKANPWGDQPKLVEKEASVETPKSNKLTYILIGLGALLVLAVGVLGFVVYKQAMTNPAPSTNTSKVITSSSTSSSLSTSSNTASVSVSSAISSKYYKYNTNNGKYISFDYPDGASINITGYNDKTITSFKDIAAITVSNSLVTIAMGSGGFDECRIYTYDTAVKNQIGWESPTYKIVDGVPNYVGEKGIYNMKSGSFVFQNPRFEYIVVDLNDLADAKLSVNLNPRFAVLTKNSNGKYVSECVIPETSFFTPKWTVKLDQSEYKVEPIYLTCKAKNTDDVKKCTEVLDRFVTTFRVK